MNANQYKMILLITAVPLFLMMGWCGMAMITALPVIPGWIIGTRSFDNMTFIALMAATGLITTYWQKDAPCPLPQILMSALLGVGYIVIKLVEEYGTLMPVLSTPGAYLLRLLKATAMFLPIVTVTSLLFTLLLPCQRKTEARIAFLNLFMVIFMSIASDPVRTLLHLPKLEWTRILYAFPGLRYGRYMVVVRNIMNVYMRIPLVFRACAGAAGLCAMFSKLFREAENRLNGEQRQPPVQRYTVSPTQYRAQQPAAQMNARDLELLDALTAQTVSGNPVGLNTATGTVGLRRHR